MTVGGGIVGVIIIFFMVYGIRAFARDIYKMIYGKKRRKNK